MYINEKITGKKNSTYSKISKILSILKMIALAFCFCVLFWELFSAKKSYDFETNIDKVNCYDQRVLYNDKYFNLEEIQKEVHKNVEEITKVKYRFSLVYTKTNNPDELKKIKTNIKISLNTTLKTHKITQNQIFEHRKKKLGISDRISSDPLFFFS